MVYLGWHSTWKQCGVFTGCKLLINQNVYYLDGKQSSLIWIPYKFINASSIACYQNHKALKLQFSKHLKTKFYLGFNSTDSDSVNSTELLIIWIE